MVSEQSGGDYGCEEMTFRKRLLQIKNERNLTYTQMSKITGIPASTIKGYVALKNEPGAYAVIKLSKGLGVTTDWLLGLTDERN